MATLQNDHPSSPATSCKSCDGLSKTLEEIEKQILFGNMKYAIDEIRKAIDEQRQNFGDKS